ncbi:hypothetical protein CAEBREN_12258 [Caenorhabditis brenneri]|uniref:Uncharacterized protein n=1 Tax=Caenorhabditis brenneri TaxID=135651 RepID=G0NH34_CAEBE|nr:hypothetical protein CAEBREN_12258 [Caenorhabditis brenneri]
MAPGSKRATATASKKLETAPYIFYKDRLGTYKNYIYDEEPHATCTSKALARAGFISTGEDAGKCPFCLKELCFDANDDPWEEHKKRGAECAFVLLGKLDETTLTVADTIKLAQTAVIMAKYEEQVKIVNGLESRASSENLYDSILKALKQKPARTTTRRAK